MTRFIYSPKYVVDIGEHVFPTRKFAMVAEALKAGGAGAGCFIEPQPPPREDLLLAHTPGWVDRVLEGRLTLREEVLMELPWSRALAEAHALAVAGTILACRDALERGLGLHVGGGSHHAFPDHGEGFCVFNDLACGILKMRREGRSRRAIVVDLDVHQGNGTNAVFAKDPDVLTFSMHQEDIYPFPGGTAGTVDVGLPAGAGDDRALSELRRHLPRLLERHKPDLVVYQAGVDGFEGDLLGGLGLTAAGLGERDAAVFDEAARRGLPVAVTLGGGYAERLEDTVALHVQTLRAAARRLGPCVARSGGG